MKHQSNPMFINSSFLILLLLLTHSTVSITAQEVEDERDFDYIEGSGKGPENWGDIKKEWEACKNGGMQSPVDLSNLRPQIIPRLLEIKRTYKPANATLKNRGHDIMIEWAGNAGSIVINGIPYLLKQGHWHSPSEHAINGTRYDMELHMVYQSPLQVKNNIAVVGALYKIGPPDAFLSKLRNDIASMSDQKIQRSIGVIDPADVVQLGGRNNYRYLGSLTTPPCTEGVIWIISKQFGTVSSEQIELLRMAVHDYAGMNARPLQPINRRKLNLQGQNPKDKQN